MTTEATNVVGGVDTDYAAAVNQQGRLLNFQELRATDCGSPTLLAWMRGHGQIWVIGAESTQAAAGGRSARRCCAAVANLR